MRGCRSVKRQPCLRLLGPAIRLRAFAAAEDSEAPMDVVVGPLFWLLNTVIELYIWMLIASAVFSWLFAFNVVNTRNRFVYLVGDFLHRVTEPALRPIRRMLPSLGGVDLSPLVLILVLLFLQQILARLYVHLAM